jgi:hypothetical protein
MMQNVYRPDPSREEWGMLCGAAEHIVSEAWRTGHARSTFHRFFLEASRLSGNAREPGAVDLVLGFEGRELFRARLRPDLQNLIGAESSRDCEDG